MSPAFHLWVAALNPEWNRLLHRRKVNVVERTKTVATEKMCLKVGKCEFF